VLAEKDIGADRTNLSESSQGSRQRVEGPAPRSHRAKAVEAAVTHTPDTQG
jgi:hypothetical protein